MSKKSPRQSTPTTAWLPHPPYPALGVSTMQKTSPLHRIASSCQTRDRSATPTAYVPTSKPRATLSRGDEPCSRPPREKDCLHRFLFSYISLIGAHSSPAVGDLTRSFTLIHLMMWTFFVPSCTTRICSASTTTVSAAMQTSLPNSALVCSSVKWKLLPHQVCVLLHRARV